MTELSLTTGQRLMWAGQKLSGDAPLYNMAWRFDIRRDLDPDRFSLAFDALEARSDCLRLVIAGPDDDPMQSFAAPKGGRLQIVDLSGETDIKAAAKAWCDARVRRPFALDQSTTDTALLKMSDDRWCWYLCQHHVATDARSGSLLAGHLSHFYELACQNRLAEAPELPQFAAFARMHSEPDEENATLEPLPLHRLYGQAPGRVGSAARRITVRLDDTCRDALNDLVKQDGFRAMTRELAQYNIFATVFCAYLARISGDDVLTFGTTVNTRGSLAFQQTPGPFAEIFPMRVSCPDVATFRSLHGVVVEQSKTLLGTAQAGQSSAAGQRAFNTVLNYVKVENPDFAGSMVEPHWIHSGHNDPGHHVRMNVLSDRAGVVDRLCLDFNEDVFRNVNCDHATGHLMALLDAFLTDPDASYGTVPLTTPEERADLLAMAEPSAPVVEADPELVLDRILHFARTRPDTVALVEGEDHLTYADLLGRTARLARGLVARGVGPGDFVGLHMHRSIDLIVAMLGTWQSGAAYIPLEPGQPPTRLANMLEEAQPRLVLVQAGHRPDLGAHPVDLEDVNQVGVDDGDLPPMDPKAIGYVMFTSGSTGRPKGVLVSHEGIAMYLAWKRRYFSDLGAISMPLCSSIAFDLTVMSIYAPLTTGGTVHIYPETAAGSDLSVIAALEEDAVNFVQMTPAHLAMVVEASLQPKRLQTIVVAGEAFPSELALRASELFGPDITMFNEYGPTEAVVGCTIFPVDPMAKLDGVLPIGTAADYTRTYILDEDFNPLPIGVPGDFFLGGRMLADGYFNRPEQSAAAFLPDPFIDGGRMYRTGDRARIAADGTVAYLGRKDRQIKINGVRIELGEIEQILMDHPDVSEAVVDTFRSVSLDGSANEQRCRKCGLADNFPGVTFDAAGECSICRDYHEYEARAHAYWQDLSVFEEKLSDAADNAKGNFDCIVLLSGGKDSVYALYRVAQFGKRILALTLDNGFISEGAKDNCRAVAAHLGVVHRFMSTPAMNDIFVDSLKRHANVCPGCFKTIYTLALKTALAEGIPMIVTGLSRGQLFDTRLAPELFSTPDVDMNAIDQRVKVARKRYHRVNDAVFRSIDVTALQNGSVFDQVEIVDFYRYLDVGLDEVLKFLSDQTPWLRPDDTGRSTNCLINDVGIYIHKRQRGYHNYAHPYSWDVRLGHKTREAALAELDDEIDTEKVQAILDEIGYDGGVDNRTKTCLVAYVTGQRQIGSGDVLIHAARHLPKVMVPSQMIQIDSIPLSATGKIDRAALPAPNADTRPTETPYRAPETETQRRLAKFWAKALRIQDVGLDDNYYDIGGDSISAIRIEAWARAAGLQVDAAMLFEHQTIAELAGALATKQDAVNIPDMSSVLDTNSASLDQVAALLAQRQDKR